MSRFQMLNFEVNLIIFMSLKGGGLLEKRGIKLKMCF